MCIFLLQNGALWDICLMHYGFCEVSIFCTDNLSFPEHIILVNHDSGEIISGKCATRFSCSIISQHWMGTGCRNSFPWKTRTFLTCINNIMIAGVLVLQGAMILTQFIQNILVSAPDGLTCFNSLRPSDHRTIIGSYNGLSPGQHQAIIWTNDGILLIAPSGMKFCEI